MTNSHLLSLDFKQTKKVNTFFVSTFILQLHYLITYYNIEIDKIINIVL